MGSTVQVMSTRPAGTDNAPNLVVFVQSSFSVIAIAIFSAFMLYDVNRIVTGGETNYITATLALYLDVYNVFVNLLAILGITGGSHD